MASSSRVWFAKRKSLNLLLGIICLVSFALSAVLGQNRDGKTDNVVIVFQGAGDSEDGQGAPGPGGLREEDSRRLL